MLRGDDSDEKQMMMTEQEVEMMIPLLEKLNKVVPQVSVL